MNSKISWNDQKDQIDPSFTDSQVGPTVAAVAAAAANARDSDSKADHQMVSLLTQSGISPPPVSSRTQFSKSLNPSKRAEQNRNAQRAFRRRKEQYVKELQERVSSVKDLELEIAQLKEENQSLRDYILSLQSKLISEIPPAALKK